jgi:transposase-like protein
MTRHNFTPRQKTEMLARYVAGETAKQVADSFGCTLQTVLRIIKDQDPSVVRPSGPGHFTSEQKQEIADRYTAGESLKILAKEYGCSVPNVQTIVKNRGVVTRPLGLPPMPEETVEAIRKLRLSGKSYREIGMELDLHPGTVGVICRNRLGLATSDLEPNDETRLIRTRGSLSGEDSPSWRGGRHINRDGYVMVYVSDDDPLRCMSQPNGYVLEHRLVMARKLGRPLTRYETVHHKNSKDKTNNDPSNLQLRWGNHGKGHAMRCLDCGSDNLGFEDLA